MKQTTAPRLTPSPSSGGPTPHQPVAANRSPGSIFVSMALDMSWRLALVVLVPIIGGFKLDQALKTAPWLTVAGFIVAMAGMGYVMWRSLKLANQLPVAKLTAAQKRAIKKQYQEDDDD